MIAYHASVLRYCPDTVAGEFANVALLLAERDADGSFVNFRFKFATHTERLSKFFLASYRRADWTLWRRAINDNFNQAYQVAEGQPVLPHAGSFEAILAAVSPHSQSSFRWSIPFIGAEVNLDEAFEYWFLRLIMRNEEIAEDDFVSDEQFWRNSQPGIEAILRPALVNDLFSFDEILGGDEPEQFRVVWQNGTLQALDVISLTVKTARTIKAKQQRTIGKLWGVRQREANLACSLLVSRPTEVSLTSHFEHTKNELLKAPGVRTVIEPNELGGFLADAMKEARPRRPRLSVSN